MTQLAFRAKAYYQPNGIRSGTILYSGHTTRPHADRLLAAFLQIAGVTGGNIEEHIQGQGWCLANDGAEERERRRVDGDFIYPNT